ncbi:PIN domain-containing protein [uncultured Chryseobacterium sp.]|uniref:PIN-like domain-containing protein n=1 Tax=uncultured Chryseobacterium sp. TaxID=259322 RepID=UPI00258DB720|nr:PIN domain-containing protein [uncultured Chryseobacterium sp.]
MKEEFIGFYSPTQEETDSSWNEGIFCFDANSILNLYRYSESTRVDFLNALKSLQNRLFIPYQAAYEFHTNRLVVINGVKSTYHEINNFYKKCFEENINTFLNQFKKHPALNLDSIKSLNDEFLSKIVSELESQRTTHPDFESDDSILYSITEIFENSVGKDFSETEVLDIYKDGKTRYERKIPPGYKDLEKKKKGERNIYGDLIIWKQLIIYAQKEKKPIIFVTDDRKEDWWTIEGGKTIRPREELIKEFFDLTGIRILIYNADSFLHFAKERNLISEIKDKSLQEIKDVRVSDENYYWNKIFEAEKRNSINASRAIGELMKSAEFQRIKNSSYNIDHLFPKNFSLNNFLDKGNLNDLEDQDQDDDN